MDIDQLAARYKGKITLWGEVDRQSTLPFETPEKVREAVMRVREAFDDTGLIAQCEWGVDVPKENIVAVWEAWLESR